MDDVIVIILTLLVIGIGVIKQFRKKQTESLPKNDAEKIPGQKNFWDEFMDVEREEFIPRPAPQKDFKKTEKTTDTEKNADQSDRLKPEEEGVHSIKGETIKDILKNTKPGSEKKKAHLPEGFTLRRAIIFSEILKPKHF